MLSEWLVQRVEVSAYLKLKEKEIQVYCYSESHIMYFVFWLFELLVLLVEKFNFFLLVAISVVDSKLILSRSDIYSVCLC